MNIRHADDKLVPNMIALWGKCFGDVEGQGTLFFNKRFKPEHSLVLIVDDQLAAMLFMLPTCVKVKNQSFKTAYIYAVATDPKYRSKGYSALLLNKAHELLKADGFELTMLSPASDTLFNYYAKRGYKTAFYHSVTDYHITNQPKENIELTKSDFSSLFSLRENFFQANCTYVSWDKPALEYCEMDANENKGEVLSFKKDGVEGYALCFDMDDYVLIKELGFSVDMDVLSSIAAKFHKKIVRVRYFGNEDTTAFGMVSFLSQEVDLKTSPLPFLSLVLD